MSYSDTQFQRTLLNTLDKIADELHKSNKLMDIALRHEKKAVEISKNSDELNTTIIGMNVGLISKDEFIKYLTEKMCDVSGLRKEDVNEETNSASEDME